MGDLLTVCADQEVDKLTLFDSDNSVIKEIPNPVGWEVIPMREKPLEHDFVRVRMPENLATGKIQNIPDCDRENCHDFMPGVFSNGQSARVKSCVF